MQPVRQSILDPRGQIIVEETLIANNIAAGNVAEEDVMTTDEQREIERARWEWEENGGAEEWERERREMDREAEWDSPMYGLQGVIGRDNLALPVYEEDLPPAYAEADSPLASLVPRAVARPQQRQAQI